MSEYKENVWTGAKVLVGTAVLLAVGSVVLPPALAAVVAVLGVLFPLLGVVLGLFIVVWAVGFTTRESQKLGQKLANAIRKPKEGEDEGNE
jgi:Flp pilus assembly protein TadB